MPEHSQSDLKGFVVRNIQAIKIMQEIMQDILKENKEQNERILKLSELSKGQLKLISALSLTVQVLEETVIGLTVDLAEKEEE